MLGSLVGVLFIMMALFASNNDTNSSQESNETKEKIDKKTSSSLTVNLDKLKKKSGLKGSNFNVVKGTILFSDNNDEVSVKGWNNDEVSNKGICFNGTKRTLYHGKFKVSILRKDESVFESTHSARNICISTEEIKKGTSVKITNSQNRTLAKFEIERN